jgi:hypothetical protein
MRPAKTDWNRLSAAEYRIHSEWIFHLQLRMTTIYSEVTPNKNNGAPY